MTYAAVTDPSPLERLLIADLQQYISDECVELPLPEALTLPASLVVDAAQQCPRCSSTGRNSGTPVKDHTDAYPKEGCLFGEMLAQTPSNHQPHLVRSRKSRTEGVFKTFRALPSAS